MNITSGVALDDNITESILSVDDVGKIRRKDFREKRLATKEVSFHAPIQKNNYKSFRHVMQKIRISKKDGSAKVAEVNRNILGALNSYRLKTGKPVDFQKTLSYSLSPIL